MSRHTVIEDALVTSHYDLFLRVDAAIEKNSALRPLFEDLCAYIYALQSEIQVEKPPLKKRKLDISSDAANGDTKAAEGTWADINVAPSWKMADVSFSIPQRKKLHVEIVKKDSKAGVKKGGIRGVNAASNTVEFGANWGEIDQVFCLPVPEKAKKQHNFVVLPRGADGITPAAEGAAAPEPIVWTYVEPTGKDIKEGEDPGPGTTSRAIDQHLGLYKKQVIYPTDKEFSSSIPQPHRKGEKAYHVKAFRGSKEGYLYFTSVGILFGFKKPLAFFPFDMITSVSYTSVLQRTFNLNIGVTAGEQEQEIEFAMLDQADFSGINEYVQKHSLQDTSLAATRKAKKLNINGPPKGGEETEVQEDGATELAKAEAELQDLEDEEEEDYDPGSEGDSDGSGSSSEEEDYDENAGGDEDGEGADIIAEELGSEAEEVEMSDDEGE
ncbi:Rtt106-domain-containing protein [Pseudovirgaria hyperparasitica]|uniref:Rtt106-domain-containing protein n=1 Tax=Pseudovirgaria hyperparasitica TaxID=470096 RepID=A0A6A6WF61_9PEZI|nr:Rtt106-domain-containing protein [Pseudovirgaria hyperparasitica]KAF2759751.1 Rtt106-domain-containing protein [Pseudovirgaria hyperparasitica]